MPKVSKKRQSTNRISHSNPWSSLPYPALVEIYRHLKDKDRGCAAQVCQTWEGAFNNPTLWRKKTFDLGGSKANSSSEQCILFAEKMGQHLRDVQILCRHITSNTCQSVTSSLENICSQLEQASLERLIIRDLELDSFWRHANLRPKIAEVLGRLLSSQEHIQILEISSAQFGLLPGSEVLIAASKGSGPTVEDLDLHSFFHSQLAPFKLPLYVTAILKFTNLSKITIHYCCLSDQIICEWARLLAGKLTDLRIRVCSNEAHDHQISNESWALLKTSCPQLTIEMTILGIGQSSSVLPILAPEIPLIHLHYWSGNDIDTELDLSSTLRHISGNFAQSLQQLSLDCDNIHDRVNEALFTIVARCRKLMSFTIKIIADVEVASTICQMVKERKGSLRNLDIMLCDLSEPELEELQELRESLGSFLDESDMSIILRNDLY